MKNFQRPRRKNAADYSRPRQKTPAEIRQERDAFTAELVDLLHRHKVTVEHGEFVSPPCKVSGERWVADMDHIAKAERF